MIIILCQWFFDNCNNYNKDKYAQGQYYVIKQWDMFNQKTKKMAIIILLCAINF